MTYPDGTLLRSNDQPQVWLVKGAQRHWIPSPDIFNADGFSWAAILVVSDAEIMAIPQGPDVPLYTTWVSPGPNDPPLPGPQLPIVEYNNAEYRRWRSTGGGHTIYARAEFVVQTGSISGGTVTMNSVWGAGYHSGTNAFITDSHQVIRWSSPIFRVGVNAKGFGPTVVANNAWHYDVPETIADQAAGFGVSISDSPDNLKQIMDHSVGSLVSQVAPLISAIGGLLGGSKKSGSSSGQLLATTSSSESQRRGWEAPAAVRQR